VCGPCYTAAQQQLKRKRQPKAAEEGSSSGSGRAGEEESEENCETPALRQPRPSPKQQAVFVQLPMPGPFIQQGIPANEVTGLFAGAEQQQRQGMTPDAAGDTAQPSLLPANMPPPQASTGLLVLEAAQQAAAAAAGLTEGLAGTFAALLPLPAEQVSL
jgi:hypothetical protein